MNGVSMNGESRVAVVATFTADLLRQPLKFWLDTLEIAGDVRLAPYGQVMQELLSPHSTLSRNKTGFNVLLIRPEDWIRERPGRVIEDNCAHLRASAVELFAAVTDMRSRSAAATLAFLAPPSASLAAAYREPVAQVEQQLQAKLRALPGAHCWTHTDVERLYPSGPYEDARADRIAHIPYTYEYFVAIATLFARRIAALVKPRHKVIAVDCDNTLWRGICGEDGPAALELAPEHLQLQRLLVEQHDAGVLLCLCSKNNPDDVQAVFRSRPEMLLREEHLICSRVNWSAKSTNLASLAEELGLALDSFTFIDDSAVEVAEVRAHCPSVLSLQLPAAPEEIAHFIDHTWAFDRVDVTAEGQQRSALYRQNRKRTRALEVTTDFEQFLASLELEVDVAPMQPAHLMRVAELIQRTNQFNLTTIRRSAAELETLWKSGEMTCLVVHVRDRFGDYGLVGAVLMRQVEGALEVDTFVLSCRVLNRGVEHRILNLLGRASRDRGSPRIVLRYRQTPRNAPAWTFLSESFHQFGASQDERGEGATQAVFSVPVAYAESLTLGTVKSHGAGQGVRPADATVVADRTSIARWHESAYRLSRITDIAQEIKRITPRVRAAQGEYVAPRTPTEIAVAEIWAELLAVEAVGVRADFFELGGDSLLAVRAISRVASTLGLELPLGEFFAGPTVEQAAARLTEASLAAPAIVRRSSKEAAPLSSTQQRIWFLDQLEGGSAAYHVPVTIRLRGVLDEGALRAALDALMRRHDSLRTVFVQIDGVPAQKIVPAARFALQRVDLSEPGEASTVLQQSREELLAPFNLGAGPLARGRLLRLAADEHVLLITLHHMIADGWSIGILIRELSALYEMHGDDLLEPLPIQYADYACWQRQWLEAGQSQAQLTYWKESLRGAPALLELPTDRPRPATQSYRGASIGISLNAALTADIKAVARRMDVTLAMTLHAAWSILLARLSGQDDIVIGIPVANRRRTEVEGLIGFFVNTLAIRVRLDDDPSVAVLLQRLKACLVGAYANQDVPFERVVEALQPLRSLSHSPIFQVMLALQSPSQGAIRVRELTLVEEDVPLHTAQFDVLLSLHEAADQICGSVNYATDLFDAATIEQWVERFKEVLAGVARQPQQQISRLQLLTPDESRVIASFNATQAGYSDQKLIHELFEEQVERTPHAVAVTFEQHELSYDELNARANQLARYLRARGAAADRTVGICLERSVEMVVGLLGILKSGAAYVPLDPDYPGERLKYMLEDAAPEMLLTQRVLRSRLPSTAVEALALDECWPEIARESARNLDRSARGVRPHNLAYVIYTSGSTGLPKGAMNEHRAVVNRLEWMQRQYGLGADDRVLQKTPFSFDVSVWEFFWTLMSGARLIVARPQGHQDPHYLKSAIEQAGITTLHFVPSMLQVFLASLRPGECAGVRHVVCSGEELPVTLQRQFFACLPRARLSNLYGPTEAAIDVTSWECRPDDCGPRVPIGRPISNVQMHVLDRHRRPVPIGVAAELYIGGVGVGRGYLNRPALTAERFLSDPFAGDPQARLYRTGDVGRWRRDGAIEYLGRNDHQVKIRGLRIELGEIEARLAPMVKEAVVIVREDVAGEKRLVAYVTQRADAQLNAEELRAHLKVVLPDYMIPAAFVVLERMPLTANGKLDRRGLPAPNLQAYVSRSYEAPQGDLEEILAGIWQVLLGVERVGRRDNFFELGGHSLLIVQMMERLRHVGLATEVRRVFDSPVLADLAGALTSADAGQIDVPPNLIPAECEAITPAMLTLVELQPEHIERIVHAVPGGASNVQDIYPLAPLQEGILFHHLLGAQHGDTYVVPTLLSVASRERLEQLVTALQAVIDRHDALRTAILWEHLPQPVQVVYRHAQLQVESLSFAAGRDPLQALKERMNLELQRLDVRRAPLMRLQAAADPAGASWYVLLEMHHIVADNTSQDIVFSELASLLEQQPSELPDPLPYRNHVAEALARQRDPAAFFRSKLADIDEPSAPFDLLDARGSGVQVAEAHQKLSPELTVRVRTQARRLGVSVATMFHAAWALVVARTSGRDDVVFGTVLLGRLHGNAGAQRILGMFINTLPLRLRLQNVTAQELVAQTQLELVDLLGHEQASLAVAQRCSAIAGSAPLFTTLLNFRHGGADRAAQWSRTAGVTVHHSLDRTNYPITLSVDDRSDGFELTAQTDRRIDPQQLTACLHTAVESLVEALEHASQSDVLSLTILPDSERLRIVEAFNETDASYPHDKSIRELFEEQVRRTPAATAVVYEEQSFTYAQLNVRANRLARHLQREGIAAGTYVPVLMRRSLRTLVAHLALLKCGAVYVPLDPELPLERRTFMIRDCGADVIIVDNDTVSPQADDPWRHIDCATAEQAAVDESGGNLEPRIDPPPPAYVMYTSGSTGVPKGVVVPQHAVNRLAINNGYAEIHAGDCLVHYSNPSFDASTFEIWGALLNGARLVVVPQAVVMQPRQFVQLLERHEVTHLWMTVGLFNQYSETLANAPLALRYLITGGDSLDPRTVRHVLRNNPPQHFLNAYGPTECTTFSTTHLVAAVDESAASIPIGRPIANAQIYILNSRLQVVPVGVKGELYIGGAGVACGYLGRPQLTAERFIADPFAGDPRARLYRTGDLGRWRADGTIEFLGRNDQQVKVRGFRVELGEIEAQLLQRPDVRAAVVVARQDAPGEKQLVAYLVVANPGDGNAPLQAEEWRAQLKKALPEYMVPSAFVVLDRLPLTSSGKLDRRALPPPPTDAYGSRRYEEPQGEVEELIAAIWRELLHLDRVGRNDNFFELGGHSLRAMQLAARIQSALHLELPLRLLFDAPTLESLAASIDELRRARLLQRVADGHAEVADLLEQLESLPDSAVQEWLQELRTEGTP